MHSFLEVFRPPLLNLHHLHATLESSSFGNQYNRVEILRWLPSGWRRIDLPPGIRKKDNCIKFIRFEEVEHQSYSCSRISNRCRGKLQLGESSFYFFSFFFLLLKVHQVLPKKNLPLCKSFFVRNAFLRVLLFECLRQPRRGLSRWYQRIVPPWPLSCRQSGLCRPWPATHFNSIVKTVSRQVLHLFVVKLLSQ